MARTRRPRSGGRKKGADEAEKAGEEPGPRGSAGEPPPDPWQGAARPGAGVERPGAATEAGAATDAVAEGPAARLAAELAGLPPAERYERLIDFPTDHTFKVIGAADQAFADRLRAALADLGYPGIALQPRYSSGANYVAYSLTLTVASGAAMVRIYEVLGELPGLKYLL